MPLIIFELGAAQEYFIETMLQKVRHDDRDVIVRRALDFCASREIDFMRFINGNETKQ